MLLLLDPLLRRLGVAGASSAADLGRLGEARARLFYRLRGWRVVAQNVRYQDGEIDFVARRGRWIAFVEVKTRQQTLMGQPWEAVDRSKQQTIMRLARRFLQERRWETAQVRFDVVSIVASGRRLRLTHYPDAFRPMAEPGRPWRMQ